MLDTSTQQADTNVLSWIDQQPHIPAQAAIFGESIRNGRVCPKATKLIFADREVCLPFGRTIYARDRCGQIVSPGLPVDTKTESIFSADETVFEALECHVRTIHYSPLAFKNDVSRQDGKCLLKVRYRIDQKGVEALLINDERNEVKRWTGDASILY